jgi:hypothetical protein
MSACPQERRESGHRGRSESCQNRKSQGLKRSEVPQCLNSGKEEISAALERREGWQAGYFSADRTFGDSEVESTVLISDKWVSFVAEFVKIRVIDPDILRELKLPYEACTKYECRNSTIDAIFWRAFRQGRTVGRATADHSSALDVRRRVPWVHSPNVCS